MKVGDTVVPKAGNRVVYEVTRVEADGRLSGRRTSGTGSISSVHPDTLTPTLLSDASAGDRVQVLDGGIESVYVVQPKVEGRSASMTLRREDVLYGDQPFGAHRPCRILPPKPQPWLKINMEPVVRRKLIPWAYYSDGTNLFVAASEMSVRKVEPAGLSPTAFAPYTLEGIVEVTIMNLTATEN